MSKHYQISSFIEGEGFRVVTPLNEDQLRKIQEVAGIDFMDDLTVEHSVEISEVTLGQVIESELNGASLDGFYDKAEQIRYVLDHGVSDKGVEYLKQTYPIELNRAESYQSVSEMQEKEESS